MRKETKGLGLKFLTSAKPGTVTTASSSAFTTGIGGSVETSIGAVCFVPATSPAGAAFAVR